jgi:hypothetical protein
MTCKDCNSSATMVVAYYRWGTANIGISGCEKHVIEVINVLRKHDGLEPLKEKQDD